MSHSALRWHEKTVNLCLLYYNIIKPLDKRESIHEKCSLYEVKGGNDIARCELQYRHGCESVSDLELEPKTGNEQE